MIACNIVTPQLLWFRRMRRSMPVLFVIVARRQRRHVAGAVRDRGHQPASRLSALGLANVLSDHLGLHRILSARSGCFLTLLFLFIRLLPMISIFELRELVHETEEKG